MLPDHAHKRGHSRAHDLVSSLTQQILLGTFKPGDKLPSENTLVREHGVSRTVVREALSKLQASGLVEPRHGIGTFVMARQAQAGLRVAAESAANVRDLLELRVGLESQAAALAALRRDEGQLARMRQALDDYQDLAAAGDSCIEADRRFHLLIAEATGNLYFTEMLLQLGNGLIPRNRMAQAERSGSKMAAQAYLANLEHEAILNAIRRQDPDAARAAVCLHLSNSRYRLLPD
ncbi:MULTISPECIES: FadR/GntR family transcriptional regulator [Pseudomonas]|uniref:FadR/GntR family transcriptional regulator n=1 Tax=Pseudomonas juntendi TaxID=2666183 RepID=A0AAJ5S3Z2_9PSED|nr:MULTISPECIES: FadR/GntR family transcriptional regulator [Pseudomonas]MDH1552716.1 FadR family transcriptional regulator [Pseudomonas juntendi]MDM3893790.1 FadR/GntR family transcriptional regulator [Pseudomonas juntendi]QOH71696.1 FadR family transcriptional regulator [Pseudomonas putida]WEA19975.1 FadR/GntR family transcriptional regulator [Pseudomonas juntendi]